MMTSCIRLILTGIIQVVHTKRFDRPMESALLAFVTALLALVTMLVFVHVVDHQRVRRALVQCILVALQPLLTLDSRFM